MSEQYKGYELNTAGDKNWAVREENLHKAQIDLDESQTTQIASLASLFNAGTVSVPANTTTVIGVPFTCADFKLHLSNHPVNINTYTFSDAVLDAGWVFDAGITHELITYQNKKVLHISIPPHNTGNIKYTVPAMFDASNGYKVSLAVSSPGGPSTLVSCGLLTNGIQMGGNVMIPPGGNDWMLFSTGGAPFTKDTPLTVVLVTAGDENNTRDLYIEYITICDYYIEDAHINIAVSNMEVATINSNTQGIVSTTIYGNGTIGSNPDFKTVRVGDKISLTLHDTVGWTVKFVQTIIVS